AYRPETPAQDDVALRRRFRPVYRTSAPQTGLSRLSPCRVRRPAPVGLRKRACLRRTLSRPDTPEKDPLGPELSPKQAAQHSDLNQGRDRHLLLAAAFDAFLAPSRPPFFRPLYLRFSRLRSLSRAAGSAGR